MKFPRHKASLHLTHNQHKAYYETVQECYPDDRNAKAWVNEEQKAKAIETQEVWELQWYPHTPVGSLSLLAADLDVLLNAAQEHDAQTTQP